MANFVEGIDNAADYENEIKKSEFQQLMSTLLYPELDVEALNRHIESNAGINIIMTECICHYLPIL